MCSSMFSFLHVYEKIPIFKIECLSSYGLSCRRGGGCVYIEIPLRLSPARTFWALKNMSAVVFHFLMHVCEYRMA